MIPTPVSKDERAINLYVKSRVKRSGSSFFWAMRTMSQNKRNAIYAVYAFCREVDDIADGNAPEIKKREYLDFWRREVENIYFAKPNTLLGQSLLPVIKSSQLLKRDFFDVLDGMEMDITPNNQIADLSELAVYCDRVACSVGRLSNSIFDLDRELGNKLAKSLGEALQLTNILRDVNEDYKCGKIYLPKSLLVEKGMSSKDISFDNNHPAIAKTCSVLAEICLQRFQESEQILKQFKPKQVRPAVMMMYLYRRIFQKLCNRGWLDLESTIRLTNLEKIYLVARSNYF